MVKQLIPDYDDLLSKVYQDMMRWKTLYENGGHDDLNADGVNLNLIRTQILADITALCTYYPDIPLPKDVREPNKVSYDFMAKENEIKEQITTAFQELFVHPDYLHLMECYENLLPSIRQKVNVWALRQRDWCMDAIAQGDLVTMRKYEQMDVDFFHEQCRKQIAQYQRLSQDKQEIEVEQMVMEL